MRVRKTPTPATNFGRIDPGRAVRTYHRNTRAKRGPYQSFSIFYLSSMWESNVPDVIAIKNWKTERSGYRSPMVAETEGNHSWGYPFTFSVLTFSWDFAENPRSTRSQQFYNNGGITQWPVHLERPHMPRECDSRRPICRILQKQRRRLWILVPYSANSHIRTWIVWPNVKSVRIRKSRRVYWKDKGSGYTYPPFL